MTNEKKKYTKDIVNRLGGIPQYEMIHIDLAERLKVDKKFVKQTSVDTNELANLQGKLLDLALEERIDMVKSYEDVTEVFGHHYRIFGEGLRNRQFGVIVEHLIEALRTAWADEDVIVDVVHCFELLRVEMFPKHAARRGSMENSKDLITEHDRRAKEDFDGSFKSNSSPSERDYCTTPKKQKRRFPGGKLLLSPFGSKSPGIVSPGLGFGSKRHPVAPTLSS